MVIPQETALWQAKGLARMVALDRERKEQEIDLKIDQLKTERTELKASLEVLKKMKGCLLGVERSEEDGLELRISKAERRIKDIGNEEKEHFQWGEITTLLKKREQNVLAEQLCLTYPKLSLEPLSWRDAVSGLPRLVPFQLDKSEFAIRPKFDGSDHIEVLPEFPWAIRNCFSDMRELILGQGVHQRTHGWRHWFANDQRCFYCKFEGFIPAEVKEKITQHMKDFKDLSYSVRNHIFIIAEPSDPKLFKLDDPATRGTILEDPLVVAYYPEIDEDAFWLIADFDTTTVEQAMLTHFS